MEWGGGRNHDKRDEADVRIERHLQDDMRAAWQGYVDLLEPLRPRLHAYCLRLTGNVFDAEDLVQDALIKAFAVLGAIDREVRSPRAYLLRTATNLWIDRLRHLQVERAADLAAPLDPAPAPDAGGELRDASAALLQRLSPQERAAFVMKDVFDMSLEETAQVLQTTIGAIKAALHRARERLAASSGDEPAPSSRPVPSVALVDRFVALLNAADRPGLVELEVADAMAERQ